MALSQAGRSLLPKGITQISGHFSRGEVVRLSTLQGEKLASDALCCLQGHHSDQIQIYWAMLMGWSLFTATI